MINEAELLPQVRWCIPARSSERIPSFLLNQSLVAHGTWWCSGSGNSDIVAVAVVVVVVHGRRHKHCIVIVVIDSFLFAKSQFLG